MANVRAIWWKIYPNEDRHWWMPLIWLPFMVWFFVDPIWKHAGPLLWIGNTLCGLFFIWLYLYSFSRPEPRKLFAIAAMIAMATVVIPFNSGGAGLLIYAIAAGGFSTSLRRVLALIALELAILGFYAHRLHLPVAAWGSMLLLIILVGMGNHFGAVSHCAEAKLQLAQDEIEHLAKVAERERIARDLHDLLGHTLSLITLKAELARKLVDRDPQRAKQEMQDVEHTSRAALADVREAISGYRGQGLAAELLRARQTLQTAGITVDCEASEVPLSPAQETVLALALREAVTNVVRHAQAQTCSVRLGRDEQRCTLEIADNGCGADGPEGNGLRGMRERLEAIGGSLQRHTAAGTPSGDSFTSRAHGLGSAKLRVMPAAKRDKIRVVLAEDQAMVLGALAALLEMEDDIEVIARAQSGEEALRLVQQTRPDVFITDIEMPTLTGLEVAAELKRRGVAVRVIILTTFARAGYLRRALDAGASGYLLKDMPAEQLADAVRRVHRGLRVIDPQLAAEAWTDDADPLTERERQVLRLAGEGKASSEIATELNLSEGTVRNYLSEAISKLGAANRVEAARIARAKGWL